MVIALAVSSGHLDATGAAAASLLDEDWQIEKRGADDEAVDRRENVARENVAREIADAVRFLELLAG